MIKVKSFIFNSFEENTYVLSDESGECVIIDPGCHLPDEEQELSSYITDNKLTPRYLLNTHCHIDHVLGNRFVFKTYGLKPVIHPQEKMVLASSGAVATMYGISMESSPEASEFLKEGDTVKFGNSRLEVLFTPGHSPGSITFYSEDQNFIISGDVLFERSIGRTDLPGGNHEVLLKSIAQKLLPLGDSVSVYCGHGPATTIGAERKHNPFLREHLQN